MPTLMVFHPDEPDIPNSIETIAPGGETISFPNMSEDRPGMYIVGCAEDNSRTLIQRVKKFFAEKRKEETKVEFPLNSVELTEIKAGESFELQVIDDEGHSGKMQITHHSIH